MRTKVFYRMLAQITFITLVLMVTQFQLAIGQRSLKSNNHYQYQNKYVGYEISAGLQNQNVTSSIAAFDNLRVPMEGVKAGLNYGNGRMSIHALAGLFYSNESVPKTLDLLQGSINGNLYPFAYLLKRQPRFQPYLTTGIIYKRINFLGTDPDDEDFNNSRATEKNLNALLCLQGNMGLGIEYRLDNEFNFMHIFLETYYGTPLSMRNSTAAFENTRISSPRGISLGVAFGMVR